MEYVFIGIIVFLFLLAVFDLSVGVSNDAVNFLQSAVGAKAATWRTVVIVAAVGVFIGASMSNGMMDIARHGIFRPEHFAFYDIMVIFMAVMVTDVLLLDVFNTLGLPTSTTVSMVFELLGAAFAVSLVKLASSASAGLTLGQMLNTEKALSVIMAIFVSVAVAFIFGAIVQWLARLWFTFDYRKGLGWKIGLFGGASVTAIAYFLLFKGAKDLAFMTPDIKAWIATHQALLIVSCFVVATALCQLLHMLKINVFKMVVMAGTFALAMAFAGNDLVNFIGVPLSGFAALTEWTGTGVAPNSYMMDSFNSPASTPVYFLLIAGVIMVVALATSRKAKKVVDTTVKLSRQDAGDEIFGSSRLARRLVRLSIRVAEGIDRNTPREVKRWIRKRLDPDKATLEHGAAFDLVRGSINLVLASGLIALGTSLRLPLSTTYVTFMVAMGTSLADKAWGRESAVFRITGVISVIGGWFLTAGVAFLATALIAWGMHVGGTWVMIAVAIVAIVVLLRSNLRKKREAESEAGALARILACEDKRRAWGLLCAYMAQGMVDFLGYTRKVHRQVAEGFFGDSSKPIGKALNTFVGEKQWVKSQRRGATLAMTKVDHTLAIERSSAFHLVYVCMMSMLYNMRRIAEACHEHVDNNFPALPSGMAMAGEGIARRVDALMADATEAVITPHSDEVEALRDRCDDVKNMIDKEKAHLYSELRGASSSRLGVIYVYLNMLQEQREMVSSIRRLAGAALRLLSVQPLPGSVMETVSPEGTVAEAVTVPE